MLLKSVECPLWVGSGHSLPAVTRLPREAAEWQLSTQSGHSALWFEPRHRNSGYSLGSINRARQAFRCFW